MRLKEITVVTALAFTGAVVVLAEEKKSIDPAAYTASVTHKHYPLKPGALLVLEGTKARKEGAAAKLRKERRVLEKPEVVAGVACTAIEEKEFLDGKLLEREMAYFAQGKDGAVYGFGVEETQYGADGKEKREGWRAGTEGRGPMLFLAAVPKVGDRYEIEPGEEDEGAETATVEKTDARIETPVGKFENAVIIAVVEAGKNADSAERFTFAPGVGLVASEEPGEKVLLIERR